MGHRAIVAYQRPDGLFDIRYSHWGSHNLQLAVDIDEDHPLGGDAADYEPGFITALVASMEETGDEMEGDVEMGGKLVEKQDDTPVKPEISRIALTIAEVCEFVDGSGFTAEALYIVTSDFDVRAFKPLSVKFDDRGTLLLEPRWVGDDPVSNERDRGWFKGMREELARFVEEGVITEAEAADRLIDHTLEKFDRALSKLVLGHSTALDDGHMEAHPAALVAITGRTRRNGRMVPTGYSEREEWELPDDFTALPAPASHGVSVPGATAYSHGDD